MEHFKTNCTTKTNVRDNDDSWMDCTSSQWKGNFPKEFGAIFLSTVISTGWLDLKLIIGGGEEADNRGGKHWNKNEGMKMKTFGSNWRVVLLQSFAFSNTNQTPLKHTGNFNKDVRVCVNIQSNTPPKKRKKCWESKERENENHNIRVYSFIPPKEK